MRRLAFSFMAFALATPSRFAAPDDGGQHRYARPGCRLR